MLLGIFRVFDNILQGFQNTSTTKASIAPTEQYLSLPVESFLS